MIYLFNWLSGQIEASFESDGDKILLDSRGDDSLSVEIPFISMPQNVRDNWRGFFTGGYRGLAYSEPTANGGEIIVAAGNLQFDPSLRDGKIILNAESMKEYLSHVFYENGTTVTNRNAAFEYNGTAVNYIKEILANVTSRPTVPSMGAPVGGNGLSAVKTWDFFLRDVGSNDVGSILDNVANDPQGVEMRFQARRNGNRIEFYPMFPASGQRLVNVEKTHTINLSDGANSLVSVTPAGSDHDFFNKLWNEINTPKIENPTDEEKEIIDIRVNSDIANGWAEFAAYENYSQELTEGERQEQNTARLNANKKPMENWEVEIFNEAFVNDIKTHPASYVEAANAYLGSTVSIVGGSEYDSIGLNNTLRCVGLEFESRKSLIRLQLADVRSVYPRLPRSLKEEIKGLVIPPAKLSEMEQIAQDLGGGDTSAPPDWSDFEVEEPDWEWGTEPPGLEGVPPLKLGMYGFKMGEIERSNPWEQGENMPTVTLPVTYPPGYADQWLWTQGSEGSDVYASYIDGNTLDRFQFQSQSTAGDIGATSMTYMFKLTPDSTGIKFPPFSANPGVLKISAGRLIDGRLNAFKNRYTFAMQPGFFYGLMFNSGQTTPNDPIFKKGGGGSRWLLVTLTGVETQRERVIVEFTMELIVGSGVGYGSTGFLMKRNIVLKKTNLDIDATFRTTPNLGYTLRLPVVSNQETYTRSLTRTLKVQGISLLDFYADTAKINVPKIDDYKKLTYFNTSIKMPIFFEYTDKIPYPGFINYREATDKNGAITPVEYRMKHDERYRMIYGPGYCVAKEDDKMNLYSALYKKTIETDSGSVHSYGNIALKVTGLSLHKDGLSLSAWKQITKNRIGAPRGFATSSNVFNASGYSYTNLQNPETRNSQLLTVQGAPLSFWFDSVSVGNNQSGSLTPKNSNYAIYWAYLNRFYVSDGKNNKNIDFVPSTYGNTTARVEDGGSPGGMANMPKEGSEGDYYTVGSLIPQLTYNGKYIKQNDKPADSHWLYSTTSNYRNPNWNTVSPPTVFYWDGYIYLLPNLARSGRTTNDSFGESFNTMPYIPQLISAPFTPLYDAIQVPKGDEMIKSIENLNTAGAWGGNNTIGKPVGSPTDPVISSGNGTGVLG